MIGNQRNRSETIKSGQHGQNCLKINFHCTEPLRIIGLRSLNELSSRFDIGTVLRDVCKMSANSVDKLSLFAIIELFREMTMDGGERDAS